MPSDWYLPDSNRRCWMCAGYDANDRAKPIEKDGRCEPAAELLLQSGYPTTGDPVAVITVEVPAMTCPDRCESFDMDIDRMVVQIGYAEVLELCPDFSAETGLKQGRDCPATLPGRRVA